MLPAIIMHCEGNAEKKTVLTTFDYYHSLKQRLAHYNYKGLETLSLHSKNKSDTIVKTHNESQICVRHKSHGKQYKMV